MEGRRKLPGTLLPPNAHSVCLPRVAGLTAALSRAAVGPPERPSATRPCRTKTGEAPGDPGARREEIGHLRPTSNAERRDASPVDCNGRVAACCNWGGCDSRL